MSGYHPNRKALERFVGGHAPAVEEHRIEQHLRAGCAVCQEEVDRLLPAFELAPATKPEPVDMRPASTAFDAVAWEQVYTRLEQRIALISLEREAAPRLLEELNRQPAETRRALARSGRRFQTPAVCELLIERSFDEGFRDTARARELAELAIEVACQLDAQSYGRSVVQDLKARAWAYLGNARRLSTDFTGAEQAISLAEELAEDGSADPLEEARILDFKASLLRDEGRLEEAAQLLDVVIDIYEEIKDTHRQGRALISKGLCMGDSGHPEKAIDLISTGLSLIQYSQEPRLSLIARYNLLWYLSECGRCEQAMRQLERLRLSCLESSDTWFETRLIWLEGRIASGLGHVKEAEARLREVQRRLLEQQRDFDACAVTLDLASFYLQQDQIAEVRQLIETMLPFLLIHTREVYRQATVALIAVQQAAEANRLTPRLIREVASYLRRAQRNPQLPFRETATA
jgi:tetratricopeptide (TPR) repeat protein